VCAGRLRLAQSRRFGNSAVVTSFSLSALWAGALRVPRVQVCAGAGDHAARGGRCLSRSRGSYAGEGPRSWGLHHVLGDSVGWGCRTAATRQPCVAAIQQCLLQSATSASLLQLPIRPTPTVRLLRPASTWLGPRTRSPRLQAVKPGMWEYQAESLYLHTIYSQGGCRGPHYTPIFASGPNAGRQALQLPQRCHAAPRSVSMRRKHPAWGLPTPG
jgi:hypothetical protein